MQTELGVLSDPDRLQSVLISIFYFVAPETCFHVSSVIASIWFLCRILQTTSLHVASSLSLTLPIANKHRIVHLNKVSSLPNVLHLICLLLLYFVFLLFSISSYFYVIFCYLSVSLLFLRSYFIDNKSPFYHFNNRTAEQPSDKLTLSFRHNPFQHKIFAVFLCSRICHIQTILPFLISVQPKPSEAAHFQDT